MAVELQRKKTEPERSVRSRPGFTLYEALSLTQSQAVAFDLPLADIALDDFDADHLIGR
jgi:hypothetical protein